MQKAEEIPPKHQFLTYYMASYQKTVKAQRPTPLNGAREEEKTREAKYV